MNCDFEMFSYQDFHAEEALYELVFRAVLAGIALPRKAVLINNVVVYLFDDYHKPTQGILYHVNYITLLIRVRRRGEKIQSKDLITGMATSLGD